MFQNWIICFRSLIRVPWILWQAQHCYRAIGAMYCAQITTQAAREGFSAEETLTLGLEECTEASQVPKGNWSNDRGPVFRKNTLAQKTTAVSRRWATTEYCGWEGAQPDPLQTGSSHLSYGENSGLANQTVSAAWGNDERESASFLPSAMHLRRPALVQKSGLPLPPSGSLENHKFRQYSSLSAVAATAFQLSFTKS